MRSKWILASGDGGLEPEKTELDYVVQWQLRSRPGSWENYSIWYKDKKDAISSMQAAAKVPNVIALRIVCRQKRYRVLPDEETMGYLKSEEEKDNG